MDTFGKRAKSILSDGYDIACRSIELNKTVPKLSEIIRNIPEFEEEEACNFTRGSGIMMIEIIISFTQYVVLVYFN